MLDEPESRTTAPAVVIGSSSPTWPPGRSQGFWRAVEGLLGQADGFFFIDEAVPGVRPENRIERAAGITRERLRDGSVHRAVKVLWQPEELAAWLGELGWTASVRSQPSFSWGTAVRASADGSSTPATP